ncbi:MULTISPECIES: hypothetical protein [Mycetohabitans]|nr:MULTISPECIES: hypothetical protein [Mycetohabitans]MCG1046163.1 hypothetical protein [Mycetohabitans sp. B6]
MTIGVQIDPQAWRAGVDADDAGHAMTPCPAGLGPLSYFSGWIEKDAKHQGNANNRPDAGASMLPTGLQHGRHRRSDIVDFIVY